MATLTYPITLPGPAVSAVTPTERRLPSDVTGGPQQFRGIQRDYLGRQRVEWTNLNATEAAILDAWFTTTLNSGGSWFASTWPAPQGWVELVRRFIGAPRWAHKSGQLWDVSADVLVRGRGVPPALRPVVMFTSSCIPPINLTDGATALLSWTVTDATTVSISPGIGAVGSSGTAAVPASTPYILTATNSAGSTVVAIRSSGHWTNYPSYGGMPINNTNTSDEVAALVAAYACRANGNSLVSWAYDVGGVPGQRQNVRGTCSDSSVTSQCLIYTAC